MASRYAMIHWEHSTWNSGSDTEFYFGQHKIFSYRSTETDFTVLDEKAERIFGEALSKLFEKDYYVPSQD
jgi:hypothetical protein